MGPASRTMFGDLCLEDLGMVVEYVHDDPPAARIETEDVPGKDGSVITDVSIGPRNPTIDCRAMLPKWSDFDELVDLLGTRVGTRSTLELRTHAGQTYDAYLESVETGEREGLTGIGEIFLSFVVPDPTRVGKSRSVTVPSGGSVTFEVGGSRPASLTIAAPGAKRTVATGAWGLRFDGAERVHVPIPTNQATAVSIDCDTRVVKVAGATSMLTLESDWPALTPGTHEVTMDIGLGTATLTWVERW